ncbi:MAG: ABC transporter permease [Treponema sp.]|nr:ABC transporter permease [Treponema sp.]
MKTKGGLSWIYYVAKRFSLVDRKGSGSLSFKLSTLGICFGVMTLIIVISVMNGFQREFIDAIMEVSSFHVRAEGDFERKADFKKFLKENPRVLCSQEFIESECLAVGPNGKQAAVLVRGLEPDVFENDKGFAKEIRVLRGNFDLAANDKASVALGSTLSRNLGVRVGDTVSLYSLSSKKPLLQAFKEKKDFVVAAIFMTGYADINQTFAYIDINCADFFDGQESSFGIKLKNSSADSALLDEINQKFPEARAKSWREYNRSFFGALRVEKNMLMLLVFLIFVVVAINIFNSMRRIVYERRFEISTLSALGGKISSIKNIFIMRGFLTGLRGAIPGLLLGIFFCVNIKTVFALLSGAIFWLQYLAVLLVSPEDAAAVAQNPMFAVYGNIPARMYAGEIFFITLFGILSAVLSSWLASREVLNAAISEVLHDE